MAKYKVSFDRTGCIGAGSCVAVHPEGWEMQADNKPNLVGSDNHPEKQEIIIEEKDLERHLEAAKACPVIVIHITNMDTGEKLI